MNILILNQQDKQISKNMIKRFVKEILKNLACKDDIEISILLTNDDFIKELNKKYLKKDKPTDVLSFPMSPLIGTEDKTILGDVVISIERAEKQAVLQKTSFDKEVARLLIHGVLHLFGYEHEKGGKMAMEMKKEEERLMGLIKNRLGGLNL